MDFKRIGVLTSGGDAPGMNAVIRAVVHAANEGGVETFGIYEGYQGLMDGNLKKITNTDVANIVGLSGTVLYTARALEFKEESGMQKAIATCKKFGIDGIVAIGGDGTFRGANDLTAHGIPTIGITGTIDNDITATDYTIGFDTAMNTVVECVEKLRDTSESHARCAVVEVMGRGAGYIALQAGIALGACGVAIPEVPFNEEDLIENMMAERAQGQRSFLVLVSEAVVDEQGNKIGVDLAKRIQSRTGIECKFSRPAHIIRGGAPSVRDRINAAKMAEVGVDLLLNGVSNHVICKRNGAIIPVEINYALTLDAMYKNRLKPGALDKYSREQIKEMEDFVEMRRSEIRALYSTFRKMS